MSYTLRVLRHLNAAVATGFTAYYIYVKNDRFEKCKKMLETKKDDPSLVLSPHIKKLVNEVMDDMNLKENERSKIKVFLSENPEFHHYGSINDPYGGLLEIPQYLLIDKNINVNVVDNKMSTIPETESLGNALHLSDKAKKFAIARELYELVDLNLPLLDTFPLTLNLYFIFFSYINEKLFKRKPPSGLHSICFLLGAFSYALAFDTIILYTETKADFLASDLGKSYLEGGIEFYKKMIEKNKALKKIDNNAPYSKSGDVNYSLFGKHHMPLYKRLEYLDDISHSKKTKPSVWKYILFVH